MGLKKLKEINRIRIRIRKKNMIKIFFKIVEKLINQTTLINFCLNQKRIH